MKKQTIWRVHVKDRNYSSSEHVLFAARTAGEAEKKAIARGKANDKYLLKGEKKNSPYVASIELVGELET